MGIEAPVWMTSLIDVSIRNTPYDPNVYKRGKSRNGQKGSTISSLAFYFIILTTKKQLFHIKLVEAINKLNNLFNPAYDPGALCIEYLKINASGICNYLKKTL